MPIQEAPISLRIFYSDSFEAYAVRAQDLYYFLYPHFLDSALKDQVEDAINAHLVDNQSLLKSLVGAGEEPNHKHAVLSFTKEASCALWIKRRIEQYCFDQGADFYSQPEGIQQGDIILTLNMAKELARIERTEQGREARYQIIDFEQELNKQRMAASSKGLTTTNEDVDAITTCDLINLIQAVRQYQYLVQFCVVKDSRFNPLWVNSTIENIKLTTGKRLGDEVI